MVKTFLCENNIFQQKHRVAVGSHLNPVYAGIFMVELKRDLKSDTGNK